MNLLSSLARGGDVFDERSAVLLSGILTILLAGTLVAVLLRRTVRERLELSSLLSLALTGGTTFLILLSLPLFALAAARGHGQDFMSLLALPMAGITLILLTLIRNGPGTSPGSFWTFFALLLLLLGLGAVRMAFIQDLVLPPYTDSVEHYQIVNDLLHPELSPEAFYNLSRLTTRYYHFGYHALAAGMAALSGAPVAQVMLVLGQILQVIIPAGLFYPARSLTRSDAAALFAVVLAGLAWRMPAFASNWGKYPALTGILTAIFAVSLFQLAAAAETRSERRALAGLAVAASAASALTHTRSLLLIALAIGSWWAAGVFIAARGRWKTFSAIAFGLAGLMAAVQIVRSPELTFMLSPYVRAGFFPTLCVAALAPFGFKHFPRASIALLLFLLSLLLCTLLPLPDELARFGYETLLDRPFGQIVLFLPLSLIGAVGLAGLGRSMNAGPAAKISKGLLRRSWMPAALLLSLSVILFAFRTYDFTPSDCCKMASADDVQAFDWMTRNLDQRAVILIASNRTPSRIFGVDGGIWITPLTGYRTEKWPFNAPMDSAANLQQICAKGVTHIYVGGTASHFVFDAGAISSGWFELVFSRNRAQLYQIAGCQP